MTSVNLPIREGRGKRGRCAPKGVRGHAISIKSEKKVSVKRELKEQRKSLREGGTTPHNNR